MKKILILVSMCILGTAMTSCDANKAKVSDLAKQFVKAANDNEKVALYEMYPASRKFSVVQLSEIGKSGIKISYDETDSVYIASLKDRQKLVIRLNEDGEASIVDTYNVFKLDADASALAAMTGVPANTLSDSDNEKMFKEDGDFIRFLMEKCPTAIQGNLIIQNIRYDWQGGSYPLLRYHCPATNYSKIGISGDDYTVEFRFINPYTQEIVGNRVEEGVDIAAGATYVFELYMDELYNTVVYAGCNLYVDYYFRFKNVPAYAMLGKYGAFDGTEYETFKTNI